MATYAAWSFRLATWYSLLSSDLTRSVSRRVAGVCDYWRWRWWLGRGGFLERGCWSEGGDVVVLLGLHRWEATYVGTKTRWSWTGLLNIVVVGKTRDRFVFLSLLEFYL